MSDFELPEKMRDLIGPREHILFVSKQKAGLKLDIRKRLLPDTVIVTEDRLIHVHPKGLIGGALGMQDYTDWRYKDMLNVNVSRGIRRSTLTIIPKLGGIPAHIKDFSKDGINQIFKLVRDQLTKVTEATTTPIHITQQVMSPPPPPPPQEPVFCPTCETETSYIQQYQRNYCYNCKKYI